MYMYMYKCKRMSCMYSMSCIYLYMCMSNQSRSRHHLARWQRRWWQCQRLETFVWECWGIWGAWTSWFFVHSEHETMESVKTEGSLGEKCFLAGKIVTLNQREFDLYHSKGVTIGREREWELPKRNDSRNHSRKYSWELWEVTSLIFLPLMGGHHSLGATFLGS